MKAKGFIPDKSVKSAKSVKTRNCTETVHFDKSRSRAGSIRETDKADLVVSASVLDILLSYMFVFPLLAIIDVNLAVFDHFCILRIRPETARVLARR